MFQQIHQCVCSQHVLEQIRIRADPDAGPTNISGDKPPSEGGEAAAGVTLISKTLQLMQKLQKKNVCESLRRFGEGAVVSQGPSPPLRLQLPLQHHWKLRLPPHGF